MRYTIFLATLPFPQSYHYSLLPAPCSLNPQISYLTQLINSR
ncbi:hypothetical protein [Moorena producens]|nr:hypothetical protein [Moorena producens]